MPLRAAALLLGARPRYICRNICRNGAPAPHVPPATTAHQRETAMAAIIALGLCFGIFAILNLIDNKRID